MADHVEERESLGDRYLRWVEPFMRVWEKLVFPAYLIFFAIQVHDHGWNWVSVTGAVILVFWAGAMFASAWSRYRNGPPPEPVPATPEITEFVRVLMHEGKTVEAIRLLREQTGLGLVEAKRETERIAASDPVYRAR